MDAGLELLRDYLPVLAEQRGFRGVSVTADREAGLWGVSSQWASELDLDASDSTVGKPRAEALERAGGVHTTEIFEQTTDAVARRPKPGDLVLLARFSMDPASVDTHISRFEREILPVVAAQKGFSALRLMANRKEGRCVLGSVWQNACALRRHMDSMMEERDLALTQGVRIDEISPSEILLIEVD